MRYAVLSDIHGNLEAFTASLEAISKDGADAYIFAGDIVGYGADPDKCIALIRTLNLKISIAGNHDWGVLELLGLDYFNEAAARALVWTKSILKKESLDFLRSLDLIYNGEVISAVHGSLVEPEKFNYIIYPDDAADTMPLMKSRVLFVGHSHRAGVFHKSGGSVRYISEGRIKIAPESKYVINAGSIGQPRDGDPRASYIIYDDIKASVEIKRVKYDVELAQKKIRCAGLPESLASRLSIGY